MNKVLWPAGTLLGPVPPAMVSCGTQENPNVLTVAWTGIVNSDPAMTYVSIRPSRHSHALIESSKEFVINLPTLKLAETCDSVGIKSGSKINKFKEYGLTALPCEDVSAPQIAEAPVSLVCKVVDVQHFRTHDMFLAEIIHVYVDDDFLDENGKLCLEKAGLLAFLHGAYYTLGREIGKMGFSVNKKEIKKKLSIKAKQAAVQDTLSEEDSTEIAAIADGESADRADIAQTVLKKDKFMINRFVKKADKKPYKNTSTEGGKKDFSEKDGRVFADRPKRNFSEKSKRDFTDRPKRDFNDKPREGYKDRRGSFEGRPSRDFGDKPKRDYGDKPHRDFSDRPRKDFSDKPQKSWDNKSQRNFSDKPKRDFGDKPRRSFGDRPKRAFGDKPQGGFGGKRDFSDKPRTNFTGETGDRPRKRYDEKPHSTFRDRKSGGFGRKEGAFSNRPRTASDTNRRTFSKKPSRG